MKAGTAGPAGKRWVVWGSLGCVVWVVIVVGLGWWAWKMRPGADEAREHRREERVATNRWEERFGSLEDFAATHAPQEANNSALVLEQLAARIPIDLVPPEVSTRPRTGGDAAKEFVPCIRTVSRYLDESIEGSTSTVSKPPKAGPTCLETHASALNALAKHLLQEDVPRWESSLEDFRPLLVPNHRGIGMLQELLLARALSQQEVGDVVGALDALEASWNLNESLFDRLELRSVNGAMHVASMQMRVAQAMEPPPTEWADRLAELDLRARYFRAMQAEALVWRAPPEAEPWRWVTLQGATHIEEPKGWSDPEFPSRWSEWQATAWERLKPCLLELEEDNDSCGLLSTGSGRIAAEAADSGNRFRDVITRSSMDYPLIVYETTRRTELEVELTRKVFEAKAARDANEGAWPAAIPGIELSFNPEAEWMYEVSDAGVMILRFSRECGSADGSLPLSYSAP